MSLSHWGMFPAEYGTGNVVVTLDDRGFVITREEILDNLAEKCLLARFKELIGAQAQTG